jgi:hypothetical protein
VVILTFIFCIFLKLIMCYMVIRCCKMTGLHHNLIIRALITLIIFVLPNFKFYGIVYIIKCNKIKFKKNLIFTFDHFNAF